MLRFFYLGRAFGIPLYVHSTALLLPAWVCWTNRDKGPFNLVVWLALLAAFLGCLLLHELGHCLMARYFGIGTRDVCLYPIGGVASLESTGEGPVEELCIALAGPAVNLIIVALLAPVLMLAIVTGHLGASNVAQAFALDEGALTLLARFAWIVAFSNFLLLAFNLIPAFPMDGGRVLRALLSFGMPRLRATEIVVPIGMVVAMLVCGSLAFLDQSPMPLVIALFVCFVGPLELKALRHQEARRRATLARQAPVAPETAPVYVQPLPEVAPPPTPIPTPPRGFTGFTWDRDRRVWVRWFNGKPLDVA